MDADKFDILPPDLQAVVLAIEAGSHASIEVIVDNSGTGSNEIYQTDATARYRIVPNDDPLKNKISITLGGGIFDKSDFVHELLHIQRLLYHNIPYLSRRDLGDFGKGVVLAIENSLEHLWIYFDERRYFSTDATVIQRCGRMPPKNPDKEVYIFNLLLSSLDLFSLPPSSDRYSEIKDTISKEGITKFIKEYHHRISANMKTGLARIPKSPRKQQAVKILEGWSQHCQKDIGVRDLVERKLATLVTTLDYAPRLIHFDKIEFYLPNLTAFCIGVD